MDNIFELLGALADGIQGLIAAQIDSVLGNGRRSGDLVAHLVGRQDLELAPGLDHGDHAVPGRQIDLAVGENRGGAVADRRQLLVVRREETAVKQKATTSPAAEGLWREELDLALVQLPERLREAVVLRYLEGRGQEEAARLAGCDKGTLSRRCTQGLNRLGALLSRHSPVMTPAVLATFLTTQGTATVPAAALSTLQSIGIGTAVASAQAALLAKSTLHALFWAKLKLCVATIAVVAAGVATPLVITSATAAKVEAEKPDQVLFRFDFEDGKLPALFNSGKLVAGPAQTGNRFCLESVLGPKGRVALLQEPALFTSTDDLALTFDVWVDARVSTVDLHLWNRTQQASQGIEPALSVQSERWVENVVVPIASFKAGGTGPKTGDVIVSLAIQTGQENGTLYVDNVALIRRRK